MLKKLGIVFLVGAVTTWAQAAPIPITNFSFEDPDVADGNVGAPAAWVVVSTLGGQIFDPTSGQYPGTTGDNAALPGTADGGQYLYMNGNADLSHATATYTFDGLNTRTTATYAANTTYTLTVAVGERTDVADNQTYKIELFAGTLSLGSVTNTYLASDHGTFIDVPLVIPANVAGATVGDTLRIVLSNLNTTAYQQEIGFDNIRLDATVIPEPASLGLLALAGVFGLQRRPGNR